MYWYSQPVMVELFGSVHSRTTAWCMAEAVRPAGLSGLGCKGVTAADESDASPLPAALTALTLKL